jgi:hypothetical protein
MATASGIAASATKTGCCRHAILSDDDAAADDVAICASALDELPTRWN